MFGFFLLVCLLFELSLFVVVRLRFCRVFWFVVVLDFEGV